jgi:hypothetical protein
MINHDYTFLHLWNSREQRLTEELERRRILRERQESAKNQKKWHTLAELVRFLRQKPCRSLEEHEYNWGVWRKVS